MKRLIACALLLAMVLTLFAGCNSSAPEDNTPGNDVSADTSALDAAVEYVKTIYKDVEESTPIDFQRVATVRVGTDSFNVAWSADVAEDLVKIVEGANGLVTIDVSDSNPEDVPYVLTATISDAAGNSKELTWNHFLPAAIVGDFSEILDMAYALEDGESMPNSCTLTGIITTIDTAWSDDYQNITVTIVMEGCEDKPIMCYRLKGEGAKDLAPGDQITVTGTIKNYKGTIEFDAGCTLDEVVKGVGETAKAPEDPAQILDEAYALAQGKALPYTATLTGIVTAVNTPWSDDYQNITVTMAVDGHEDKPVMCYRLKGDGAKELLPGDQITVSGIIKNYNGTVEFDAGCTLDAVVKGVGEGYEILEDPAEIVDAAYALPAGQSLPYAVTLTGRVVFVIDNYNPVYKNITVTMAVGEKAVICFRLKGDEVETLNINDIITVTGNLKNYNGFIEFDQGCTLVAVEQREAPKAPSDPKQIVKEAYALEPGFYLSYTPVLTGRITKINSKYSEKYGNITVTMVVPGCESQPIECYRMNGAGVENLAVGDTITVTGLVTNYADKSIQFSYPKLLSVEKVPDLATALQQAQALDKGKWLDYESTITGTIVDKCTYNSSFNSYTFYVSDGTNKVYCYSMEEVNGEELAMGDTVTVKGKLKNHDGTVQFEYKESTVTLVEKAAPDMTQEEIVDAAYALETGKALSGTYTLTGVISSVDTPYDSGHKNVTVTIKVPGKEDKPIMCFRMKGAGADVIRVGDTITVSGTLKNYKGTIEFDASCSLVKVSPVAPYDSTGRIILAAYALPSGKALDGTYTLTGKITKVDTAYSTQHSNVTVTIAIPGYESKPIMCYRLKGEGADVIGVGDTITVTGKLKNYYGTIEFDAGCALVSYVAETPAPSVDASSSVEEILAACEALENGEFLDFAYTLTGEINYKNDYNTTYNNITLRILVNGKSVQCWQMSGTGADQLAIGDVITVTGYLGKNSSGYLTFQKGCTLNDWTDNTP